MGTILSSRIKDDGKIIMEICVDYDEAVQLRGHMDNVHIFAEDAESITTHVASRGKNESTKYFLIPKELRQDFRFKPSTKIRSQKVDTKTRMMFIYVVDKLGL